MESEKRAKPSEAFIDTDSQDSPTAVFLYEFGSWADVKQVTLWLHELGAAQLPDDHPAKLLFHELLKFSVHEVINAPSKNRSTSPS
jgi:hypothetical protein